ncbi:MAG TPA: PEP-CTERM sorting domain-containing protein [Roseimicrobium sp.]|nr:PEP-CTERM sorting domain-containing protein [Roseimicrobium sp.]
MRTALVITGLCFGLVVGSTAGAAPMLWLVKHGTDDVVAESIQAGTSAYFLDLKLDTGGVPISGLQLYVVTNPENAIHYGSTQVTALGSPFTEGDVAAAPISGTPLQQSGAAGIALFKGSAGDYPAVDAASILQLELDTASLAAGEYLVTPLPDELSNANEFFGSADFAESGSFRLTVTAAPEPASLVVFGLGGYVLLTRRRAGSGPATARINPLQISSLLPRISDSPRGPTEQDVTQLNPLGI